jgi:hypothetical protein
VGGKKQARTSAALKVLLAMWLLVCGSLVALIYPRTSERTAALANLYYQAPAIVLMALWLWGANLWMWSTMRLEPHPLVGSCRYCAHAGARGRIIPHTLNPRVLSHTAHHDVASVICQDHCPPSHPSHSDPLIS